MSNKGQISVFVIIGIIIVIIIGFFALSNIKTQQQDLELESQNALSFSEIRVNLEAYIKSCIRDFVEKNMEDTGIREDTLTEYENLVSLNVEECANDLLSRLKEQQYTISQGEINTNIEINDETVVITLTYPITIEKNNQRIDYKIFQETFDRTNTEHIPDGVTDKEVRIPSNDGRAELVIPPGVTITDEEGNPVEDIGIRVEDLHFDGLENNVVIGNLVFETKPSGVKFSEPIELSIEFRDQDFPAGTSTANLAISSWDPVYQIWRGVPTIIKGNRALAKINDFSYKAVTDCVRSKRYVPSYTERIYQQRYKKIKKSETEEDNLYCDNDNWEFSGDKVIAKYNKVQYSDFDTQEHPLESQLVYGGIIDGETVNCKKRKGWYDTEDDFKIGLQEFDTDKKCFKFDPNNPDHMDPEDPEKPIDYSEHNPDCDSKTEGNPCGEEAETVCVVKNNNYNFCKCVNPEETEETFGYPHHVCVGGWIDASSDDPLSDEGYVARLDFEGEGNACVLSTWVSTACSFGDECEIIPYPGNVRRKIISTGGNSAIVVKGINVINANEDACASGDIIFNVVGQGIEGRGLQRSN